MEMKQLDSPPSSPPYVQSDTDLVLTSRTRAAALLSTSQPLPSPKEAHHEDISPEYEALLHNNSQEHDHEPHRGNRLNSELEINRHHYAKQKQYRRQREGDLTSIDFEGILNLIGGCSTWQMLVYCIIALQQIPHAMFALSTVYMMYQPDHWCRIPGFTERDVISGNRDYTWQQLLNSTVLFQKVSNKQRNSDWHDQCMHVDRDWSSLVNLTWKELQNLPATTALKRCHTWDYDTSIMSSTVVTQWNRVCDDNWSRAHVHLSYSLGYLVGSAMGGHFSDRFGRKASLYTFGILSLIFAMVLPFIKEFFVFLVIRFCLAASNEAADLSAYVLCMEITGMKYRSVVGSSLHAPWALGYSILALTAYLCKSWTLIHELTVGLHCLALVALFFVPESPRWLIITDRISDAEAIIRRACRFNKTSLPSDLGLIKHTEKEKWSREHKPKLTDLFRSRTLFRRNGILFIIWGSTALVYYGLVIALSDQSSPGRSIFAGNFFLNNAIAGAIELPTLFVCVVLLKSGRKSSQMVTLCGAGITLVLALLAVLNRYSTVSLVLMLLGKAFIQGAFNILYIFTSELNPTVVRSSALALSSVVSRLGSGGSGYIAILSDVTLPIAPMLIFSLCSLFAGACVIFLPETSDLPLPDTIWDAVSMHTTHKPCIMVSQKDKEEFEEEEEDVYVAAEEFDDPQKAESTAGASTSTKTTTDSAETEKTARKR